ncbi:MAG: hypothetical protein C3F08_02350 [Candidatus Methylomirabilota bacterium]|nr:MAG: hypothetical protein C3F08_02350 [candidate division NC10 bacterium]
MRLRIRGFWVFFGWALVLFLGGCGSPYLFGPTKVGSSVHLEFQDEGRGGLGGDAQMALYERGTESVVVGWEHFFGYDDDFNTRIHNHIYRGGVQFNVGLLSEPPAKTVTKATLNYTIQTGTEAPSKGFIESCATKLLLAKEDWHGIPEVDIAKAPDTILGDLYKDGLSKSPLGSKVSVDVTDAVKAWASGAKTNFGFVFVGSTEEYGLIKNNDKCWTLLGDLTLRVDYTKP